MPSFNHSVQSGVLTVTTSALQLVYRGGGLNASTVKVLPAPGSPPSAFQGWDGGMRSAVDPGNLMGTFRTLDGTKNVTLNCTVNGKDHCEWGLLSTSGWALVDDSETPVLDGDDWWTDAAGQLYPRASDTDWYLFAHGRDYLGALHDFTRVAGRIPLTPRHAAGVWWTRWYDFDNAGVRKVVGDFRSRDLPLDAYVFDMNWHKKFDWTGYSWDRTLFPYPNDTVDFLHRHGLTTAANLHDADVRRTPLCVSTPQRVDFILPSPLSRAWARSRTGTRMCAAPWARTLAASRPFPATGPTRRTCTRWRTRCCRPSASTCGGSTGSRARAGTARRAAR